jgi:hypothetical protein
MNEYEDLRAAAGVKTSADSHLLRKIETAQRVYWALTVILTAVVGCAIWVTTIRADVAMHDRAIRKIWETIYHNPLP